MIAQTELVARLDRFFNVAAFDESDDRRYFPVGYESVVERYLAEGFLQGTFNGLMLDNTAQVERVYLIVFPSTQVLDTIIAKEVERGAPGALIFSHHLADYQENSGNFTYLAEAHLQELREHHISFYVCHAPLDCHPQVSTSGAFANALKLKDQARFAEYYGGMSGVYGNANGISFHDFAKRVAEVNGLPGLRYHAVRHNGRPVNKVAVVAGAGGTPENLREAALLGCDTFVTGEWWLLGQGEFHTRARETLRELLKHLDLNIIGSSHYSSEAIVLRDVLCDWLHENIPAVDPIFVPQTEAWR
ncbi:MAG: hypothetical protein CUN49_03470 [Candidatus Thermofonsia Clade 1 bacterium]|jgi:putative NIF3 family GTP cyclohydrolase 1 type 2|uniref:GTP cyclohydrolase 1 type 2 homolog n=1 Tax=Candidatus Thermofonsia Clade 1 bacterium TaxID=2364210 RepID=A0A2M8PGY9_9CHLR|nr:MAG: hypothetical protein CUN49_03470 [Candidatus Thermofonsia Clade 1 bacterium]RMF51220.1 MAG: hypothetical protein D6749_08485 [Chloroflexota bacterium]